MISTLHLIWIVSMAAVFGFIRISGAPNNNADGTIITINEEIV